MDHLALGIAEIAASRYPNQVIVRMSDFKTNEYADLVCEGRDQKAHQGCPQGGAESWDLRLGPEP